MTAATAFSFAVVSEADADQRVACELAERLLLERVDWLQPETLIEILEWRGLDASERFLAWKAIGHEARRRGFRIHGKFRSAPGAYDESRTRLALRLFLALEDAPDAVLLVRDTDGQEERIASLEKVRNSFTSRFAVVLATPNPKLECWVLAGFEPTDEREEEVLRQLRSLLGFDPRLHAERLDAEGRKGKKNAKNVLGRLASSGSSREEACWQETDLGILEDRGKGSRLAAYLDEVSGLLVPLVAGGTGTFGA